MKRYADRGFLAVNGVELVDLVTCTVNRSTGLQRKKTMTRNGRDAGYSNGNLEVQISGELAIERKKAQIDLALADDDAEITGVFECGGERFTCIGIAESSSSITSSVGDSSKSFQWEALDIINENGESVNVLIQLG